MAIDWDKIRNNTRQSNIDWGTIQQRIPQQRVDNRSRLTVVEDEGRIRDIRPGDVEPIMQAPRPSSNEPMEFRVGEGLSNTVDVLPGPRRTTLEAIRRGDDVRVTQQPQTGPVSERSIARETVQRQADFQQPASVRQFATETAKDIVRAPQRQLTSVGIQPFADLISLISDRQIDAEYQPKSAVERIVFGDTPIKGIFDRTTEAQERTREIIGESDLATGASLAIAPLAVGALTSLDLSPVGNAGRKSVQRAARTIAKTDDVEKIASELGVLFRNKSDELKPLAERLASVTDERQVDETLQLLVRGEGNVNELAKEYSSRGIKRIAEDTSDAARTLDTVPPIKNTSKKRVNYVQKENPSFEVPDETRLNYIQRQVQDKFNRLDITQRSIRKTGREISEDADAYLQQELFHGRAAERIDNFRAKIYDKKPRGADPLIQRMKKDGIDVEDIGNYLHARHAFERNARIKEINPDIPDGGSGLTNEQAQKILDNFNKTGKSETLQRYADEFYEVVTRDRLRVLQESGLEKPETIQRLQEAYDNYVPLKVGGKPQQSGRGKGFSVAGKNVRRAFGSTKERTNPFVQALVDYENTLVKAEKNKTAQAMLQLAQENPNPNLWEVERLQYRPRFNSDGELVSLDPKFKFADNVMEARVNGDIYLITLKDEAMAKAMKNLGTERGIKLLNTANSYLRAVNTFFNPEFVITNFERDIQTALINVGGEQGARAAKNVASDVPSAMRGIWQNVRGKTDGEWSRLYQEMKEQGGRVGWFDQKTIEEQTDELLKSVRRYNSDKTRDKLARVIDNTARYVRDSNEVVESAVRLSAYKNAVNAGMTKSQAAKLAKNLTVNFNKKGNIGVAMNSLYLFANAGIQGSARIITALKHPRVRKITYGIIAGSYGINEANRAINEKEYDKIPDYVKDTNYVFMMPNGNYIKIRLPYGYNIFKVLGDEIYNQVHGRKTVGEGLKHMLLAADTAFNPLSSGTIAQMISPTLTDPLIQQAENKNWFGGPIKPEQPTFGPQKRESSLYFSGVRPQSKAITEWLNDVTGGSEIEAGAIDWSPELVDHYVDFLTGGVGRFVANTIAVGTKVTNSELPETNNMPFIRQIIGQPFEEYERTTMYDLREKSSTQELTQREQEKLRQVVKDGLLKEQIDTDTASRVVKDVLRNQARITAGQVFDDLKDASPEEKKQAVRGMNKLEREEFLKIIKKRTQE